VTAAVHAVQEHCLVGIKGKVIRREDHAFVHANCDTDIIVSEEPPLGSTEKPEELYNIIERFCNGR
jgi:mRNA (2'-O-methyladenosine-N6-)-methyltransferase